MATGTSVDRRRLSFQAHRASVEVKTAHYAPPLIRQGRVILCVRTAAKSPHSRNESEGLVVCAPGNLQNQQAPSTAAMTAFSICCCWLDVILVQDLPPSSGLSRVTSQPDASASFAKPSPPSLIISRTLAAIA